MQSGDRVERIADNVTGVAVSYDPAGEEWRFVFDDVPNVVQAGPESGVRVLASHGSKQAPYVAGDRITDLMLKNARKVGALEAGAGHVIDALNIMEDATSRNDMERIKFELRLLRIIIGGITLRIEEM